MFHHHRKFEGRQNLKTCHGSLSQVNSLGLLPFTTSFVNFHHFRANYLKVKFEHVRACGRGTRGSAHALEKLRCTSSWCGAAVRALGPHGDVFARLLKCFPQTGLHRPVSCPLLRSEGSSMAVTCSAHAMSHVKVHHGPPPGHWNGRWRRGTTLKIWHPAKMTSRGCGLCSGVLDLICTQQVPTIC